MKKKWVVAAAGKNSDRVYLDGKGKWRKDPALAQQFNMKAAQGARNKAGRGYIVPAQSLEVVNDQQTSGQSRY